MTNSSAWRKYAAKVGAFAAVIAWCCQCAGADSAALQGGGTADRILHAWVFQENDESYSISMDNRVTTTIDRKQDGLSSFSVEGVLYELTVEGMLGISTDCQDLYIKAAECADWMCMVPIGNAVLARMNPNNGTVDIIAPYVNSRSIRVQLCDRGWVDVRPGAQIRFYQLSDGTYFVSAIGEVKGETGDGQPVVLNVNTLPMTGGPLVPSEWPGGGLVRLSPITPVTLIGSFDNDMNIQVLVGGQLVSLSPTTPTADISLPNGSRLGLTLNVDRRTIDWSVTTGYFEFKIDGLDGWRAIGLTGQSASQQWNLSSQTVSLVNSTSEEVNGRYSSVLLSPTSGLLARIESNSTLQITKVPGTDAFTTAAVGKVYLYNPTTGSETSLDRNNLLFVRGEPSGSLSTSLGTTRRMVIDSSKDGIRITGDVSSPTIAPGTTKVLETDSGRVEVTVDANGKVKVKVLEGDILVLTSLDPKLGVSLNSGSSVNVEFDKGKGQATFTGDPDNKPKTAAFVFVGSKTGDPDPRPPIDLDPGTPITIATQPRGGRIDEDATRVFTEGAGGGDEVNVGPAPAPPTPGVPGTVTQPDSSRIIQPPISGER